METNCNVSTSFVLLLLVAVRLVLAQNFLVVCRFAVGGSGSESSQLQSQLHLDFDHNQIQL